MGGWVLRTTHCDVGFGQGTPHAAPPPGPPHPLCVPSHHPTHPPLFCSLPAWRWLPCPSHCPSCRTSNPTTITHILTPLSPPPPPLAVQFASLAVVTLPITLPFLLDLQAAGAAAVLEGVGGLRAIKRSAALMRRIRWRLAVPFVGITLALRLLDAAKGYLLAHMPPRWVVRGGWPLVVLVKIWWHHALRCACWAKGYLLARMPSRWLRWGWARCVVAFIVLVEGRGLRTRAALDTAKGYFLAHLPPRSVGWPDGWLVCRVGGGWPNVLF